MTSLRKATTGALAVVFSTLAILGGVTAYLSTVNDSNEFLDLQQRQIARYVGDLTFIAPGDAALPPHDSEDDYVIEVTYRDGRPPRGSGGSTIIPYSQTTGFSEFENEIGKWRAFSLVTENRTVQVAQQVVVREELAEDATIRSVLPFVLAVPLSWMVVSLVVGRVFSRLEGLAADVARREPSNLSEIGADDVPKEVLPFVLSVNTLLVRLQRLMARQRDFISDAAHELRTPLAALTLQVGNLEQHQSDHAEFGRRLKDLEAGARRISVLSSQLMQYARYDSLRAPPERHLVRLDDLLKDVVSALLPLADNQSVDLGFAALVPIAWEICLPDVRTILEVLIDNALRYTPAGGEVDVSIARSSQGVFFAVSDTGPGVPDDMIPRLTERFFRGVHPHVEGSGLGLAIAKAIADRHDLDLYLENRPNNKGFTARLLFR